MPKQKAAQSDLMSKRIKQSGMIQPGAKPQFQRDTPLDKTVRVAKRIVQKVTTKRGK